MYYVLTPTHYYLHLLLLLLLGHAPGTASEARHASPRYGMRQVPLDSIPVTSFYFFV